MSDVKPNEIDQRQLDRLVDGELSGHEYRQLLATLDAKTGGWRRCAMAFLEAQAWQEEFPLTAAGSSDRPVAKAAANRPARGLGGFALAVAASFVVAFSLGVAWRGGWRRDIARPRAAEGTHLESVGATEPPEGSAAPIKSAPVKSSPAPERAPRGPAGHVTLVVDRDDGTVEEFDLPVFEPEALDQDWLEQARTVPARIERDFQRLGFEVRRDVRWEPLELGRGRRVFVPWREIELVPVSRSSY